MRYKKKGSTLIELLLYMSLSLVISLIGMKILLDTRQVYYKNLDESLNSNHISEGFIRIEEITKEEDKDKILERIEVLPDSIKFYCNDYELKEAPKGKIIKELMKINDELVFVYHKKVNEDYIRLPTPINTIMDNIEEFHVIKKGKLVYISVKRGGEVFIKCI